VVLAFGTLYPFGGLNRSALLAVSAVHHFFEVS